MIKLGVWQRHERSKIPKDRRLIGCKWVFKIKNDGRHRARLCAMGYTQVAGLDFTDNFAPVINDVAFRIAIVLMLVNNWEADIVDIETAFLYGNLEKEIFMKISEGMDVVLEEKYGEDDCLLLLQTIYGLVQAARQYHKKFLEVMTKKLGFDKCLADTCLLKQLVA